MTSLIKFLKEVYNYRELLVELVKRDLKIKYRRSFLGILWSVLNPLLFMAITSIIFSTMFKVQIPNFPIYFLCGQIIYSFFAEATSLSQVGILSNGSLIKKVYTPKYIFPLSKVIFSMINTFFSLLAILIIIAFMRYQLPVTALLFFVPILFVFLFSTGIGLVLSTLTVFYRDILHLYGIVLSVLSFFCATFYPIEIIPKSVQPFVLLNPIYVFISYFRALILDGYIPDLKLNLLSLAYCMLSLIIGLWIFKKNENKLVLFI